MPTTFQAFADQLARCAQSEDEILTFVEAFAKVRLKEIIAKLLEPAPTTVIQAADRTTAPDWTDPDKLRLSGVNVTHIAGRERPEQLYLHFDTAVTGSRAAIEVYLAMTGLSDKQRSVLFPVLSRSGRENRNVESLSGDVRRLNAWLDWVRSQDVDPTVFTTYHRHLAIHGAGQNIGGKIGAAGAAIAIEDALNEIAPGRISDRVGRAPRLPIRSPLDIYDHLLAGGETLRALLLDNGRAVVFASDPDVAIFQSLGPPFTTAAEALIAYDAVRRQPNERRRLLHEFAVGEVKTATDRANLHERLALGSRETRDEVLTDRFLMMAILTTELIRGGTGRRSGRTMQSRQVVRFSDVFNLHHAWGWDGARTRHVEHWGAFKARLADWCGLI
jgi:hypothetical protein